MKIIGRIAGGGHERGDISRNVAALANAGDMDPSALRLRIQDQLNGSLVFLRLASMQKRIEFRINCGKEILYRLITFILQHIISP